MTYPQGGQWQQQHAPPPPPQAGGAPQQAPPPQAPYMYPPQYTQPPYGGMAARAPYPYQPYAQPAPYGAPYPPYGGAPPAYAPRGPPVQQSSATNSYNSTVRSMDQPSSTARGGAYPPGVPGVPGVPPPPPQGYYPPGASTMSTHSHGAGAGAPDMYRPPGPGFKSVDDSFSPDEAARKAFDSADREKTGYISFREFLESLRNLKINMPYHDALDRFSKLDTDRDGRICETEWVNAYLRGLLQPETKTEHR